MFDISEKDYLNIIMAFDFGDARVGVAIKPANQASAEPLITLNNDPSLFSEIGQLVDLHNPALLVVGLPRNLEAERTAQTKKAEQFASELQQRYNIKVELQDEALSTEQAENRIPASLRAKRREFIDQYAACIILENYLQDK